MLEGLLDTFGANQWIDVTAVTRLLMRLCLDLIATTLVVQVATVRLHRFNEQAFTYYAFNTVTFLLCLMLRQVPIELGFALGLFAIFGMLRYRTKAIGMRDLTYLFVVIGIAILNAVANHTVSVAELLLINGVTVGMIWFLELRGAHERLHSAVITYDRPNLLQVGREADLAADLSARTGMEIERFEVLAVDLVRKTARIRVAHRRVSA